MEEIPCITYIYNVLIPISILYKYIERDILQLNNYHVHLLPSVLCFDESP